MYMTAEERAWSARAEGSAKALAMELLVSAGRVWGAL